MYAKAIVLSWLRDPRKRVKVKVNRHNTQGIHAVVAERELRELEEGVERGTMPIDVVLQTVRRLATPLLRALARSRGLRARGRDGLLAALDEHVLNVADRGRSRRIQALCDQIDAELLNLRAPGTSMNPVTWVRGFLAVDDALLDAAARYVASQTPTSGPLDARPLDRHSALRVLAEASSAILECPVPPTWAYLTEQLSLRSDMPGPPTPNPAPTAATRSRPSRRRRVARNAQQLRLPLRGVPQRREVARPSAQHPCGTVHQVATATDTDGTVTARCGVRFRPTQAAAPVRRCRRCARFADDPALAEAE